VNYAQEARMYSDLALWTVLSSLALWRGLASCQRIRGTDSAEERISPTSQVGTGGGGQAPALRDGAGASHPPSPAGKGAGGLGPALGWLVAYGLFTALALYTQYFGALVVGFQALYVGIAWLLSLPAPRFLRRNRVADRHGRPTGAGRGIGFLAGGLALAGVLYLPWVPGALGQLRRLATTPDFWKGELTFGFIVEKVFTAFALGKSGVPTQSLPLIALAGLLFAGGLLVTLRWVLGGRRAELYALLYLLVPLVALYAIAAHNPKFTER
jgi:hypothetical protein